jgi:hypothetical protein
LLNVKTKRLNELPYPNSGMVSQVVFQKGVINEFFRAALDGLLKLDLNTSPKAFVDFSCPASLYSA